MNQTFRLPPSASRVGVIERIAKVLHNLPLGQAWELSLAEYRPKRSNQQNRYLFGVVYPTIMHHLEGWNVEDVHEFMLGSWSGWEIIEGFGAKRRKPIRRSSRLTTVEFQDYVAHIQQFMSERGVYIPDPNEMEVAA